MFCLQIYQGLIIDMINTQVIYRFALTQMGCKVNVLLNNCKQNITSLSLLVGTTVPVSSFSLPFNIYHIIRNEFSQKKKTKQK